MGLQRHRFRQIFLPRVLWLTFCLLISGLCFVPGLYGQILTLTPSLSVSERYDNNIFQTTDDRVDDFITAVTPGLHVQHVPSPDTTFDFDYRVGLEFFAENSDQNNISHRGSLQFTGPLTRLFFLDVNDTLVITEETEERTLLIEDATGLRPVSDQSRRRTIRNSADVGLRVQLTSRVDMSLLFNSLLVNVDVPDEVDEFTYAFGAELGYLTNIARGSRVSLGYTKTFHTFSSNNGVDPEDVTADFEVQTLNTGFQHAFNPKLSGRFLVGYAITSSDDPELDKNKSVVADVSLTRALQAGQATLGYRRRFSSGGGEGGSVIADTFFLSVATRLSPRITARLGANVSFFNFQQEAGVDQLFWTIRPGLEYQVLRFWRLVADYSYASTNFDSSAEADRVDQRVRFTSEFTLREHLFLSLIYRYAERRFSGGATPENQGEAFDRNEIMLMLTYAPAFLF